MCFDILWKCCFGQQFPEDLEIPAVQTIIEVPQPVISVNHSSPSVVLVGSEAYRQEPIVVYDEPYMPPIMTIPSYVSPIVQHPMFRHVPVPVVRTVHTPVRSSPAVNACSRRVFNEPSRSSSYHTPVGTRNISVGGGYRAPVGVSQSSTRTIPTRSVNHSSMSHGQTRVAVGRR